MLNIDDDYIIFDNKETITFQNQGESAVTISDVTRRPAVLATDNGAGATYYSSAIEFLIWKNSVGLISFIPKLNAIITDQNGKKYNVDLIDDGVLRSRWSIKATSQAGEGVN